MASGTCVIHDPVIVLSLNVKEAKYIQEITRNAVYGDESPEDKKLRSEIFLAVQAGLVGAR
jgi:hypothetical protein